MKRVLVRYTVKPDRAAENRAFQKDIADRLDEGPFAGAVREIGSFNFFGA